MKIFSESNLTTPAALLFGILGVLVVLVSLSFAESRLTFFGGILLGVLMIAIASACTQARTLGLKPLTNDPLGWRAVKKANDQASSTDKDTQDAPDKSK